MKKLALATLFTAATLGASFGVVSTARAGEGHWSIGQGVQCKLVKGVVICSKSRP